MSVFQNVPRVPCVKMERFGTFVAPPVLALKRLFL